MKICFISLIMQTLRITFIGLQKSYINPQSALQYGTVIWVQL
jgi:hypothetical protein